jgi:hypothetical protein
MNDYRVLIAANDKKQTYIGSIGAHAQLTKLQAECIANDLNASFAARGIDWFTTVTEIEG